MMGNYIVMNGQKAFSDEVVMTQTKQRKDSNMVRKVDYYSSYRKKTGIIWAS